MIGIILGFIIHSCKNQKVKISEKSVRACWIVAVATIVFYFLFDFQLFSKKARKIHQAIEREVYAVAIGWIVFASHVLKSDFLRIGSFLSHNFFQPLSKMCLSIYIAHCMFIVTVKANEKDNMFLYAWLQIHLTFGDIISSLLLSFVLYLFFEAPFIQLVNVSWGLFEDKEIKKSFGKNENSILLENVGLIL